MQYFYAGNFVIEVRNHLERIDKDPVFSLCLSPADELGITKVGQMFVCLSCGYKSNDGSNARCHFRLKHLPQEEAACHVCNRVFKNSFYRDRHRARAHGITKKMLREGSGGSSLDLAAFAPHFLQQ